MVVWNLLISKSIFLNKTYNKINYDKIQNVPYLEL